MAVINDPSTAANVARVGPVDTSAGGASQHVVIRPDDSGSLGHYYAHVATGTIGAGAPALSEIVQLRYTGGNRLVLYLATLDLFRSGVAFVAGAYLFDIIRSINWTVDGSGGVTQAPIRMRTTMPASVATVRVATTAALGAGTKTLDPAAIRAIRGIVSTAADAMMMGTISSPTNVTVGSVEPLLLFPAREALIGAYPLVLAANEGVSIRATVPGTGTWSAAFTLVFSEVPAY